MEIIRTILFLPVGASSIAEEVDLLHAFVIGMTMLGSTGVFVAALWFMWRYPHRDRRVETERVQASVTFEACMIGGLLSLFILWWAIGYEQYQRMQSPPPDAIDIHVIAKQWMWQFADERGRRSQSVLVVPRGQPVRLIMTSRDVIHSFFVPAFRLKQDVVPGVYTMLWFEANRVGSYDVYCAEYCGLNHSRMRASVVVLEPWDYERYLSGAVPPAVIEAREGAPPLPREDLVATGERLAVQYACFACHTVTGEPHIAPSWRGLYGSIAKLEDGSEVLVDDAYLTESMMEPNREVVRGFEPVMPSFRGVLSAGETAAIVAYIRSLADPAREPPPIELPPVVPVPRQGGEP